MKKLVAILLLSFTLPLCAMEAAEGGSGSEGEGDWDPITGIMTMPFPSDGEMEYEKTRPQFEAAEERDPEMAAAAERREEEDDLSSVEEEGIISGPPAPAPSPEEPSGEDADGMDAEADRARVEKNNLAVRLAALKERGIDVANLWNRLGREGTDLADLEKEIASLEAGPERGASLSLGGKAGTVSPSSDRKWWKPTALFLKVAGPTSLAIITGGYLTRRHVRTRRAQGKPTVFDRAKGRAEKFVQRLVCREKKQA